MALFLKSFFETKKDEPHSSVDCRRTAGNNLRYVNRRVIADVRLVGSTRNTEAQTSMALKRLGGERGVKKGEKRRTNLFQDNIVVHPVLAPVRSIRLKTHIFKDRARIVDDCKQRKI